MTKLPITKEINSHRLNIQLTKQFLHTYMLNFENEAYYVEVPDGVDPAEVQIVIDNHDPSVLLPEEIESALEVSAKTTFRSLPNWSTWTPEQGKDYVLSNVLGAYQTTTDVNTYIDTNVTDLAKAKIALKLLAGAIIDIRTILSVMAQAILLLRDIAVRKL